MKVDNRAHEHFCERCFGRGGKRHDGWWRCLDKKCVKVPAWPCKKHADAHKTTQQKARS